MHDPNKTTDGLKDRLADQALEELLGGQRPPDLSAQILAAAKAEGLSDNGAAKPTPAKRRPKRKARFGWKTYATAASLFISLGAGTFALAVYSGHIIGSSERSVASANNLKKLGAGLEIYHDAYEKLPFSSRTIDATRQPAGNGSAYPSLTLSMSPEHYSQSSSDRHNANAGVNWEVQNGADTAPNIVDSIGVIDSSPLSGSTFAGTKGNSNAGAQWDGGIDEIAAGAYGPVPNAPPVIYPSREDWERLTARGKKWQSDHGRVLARLKKERMNRQRALASLKLELKESRNELAAKAVDGQADPQVIRLNEQIAKIQNQIAEGRGPGQGGDKYSRIVENPFVAVFERPLSTFSIDVDTASYANARQFLLQDHRLPPPDAVRIEELVNYFDYDYEPPKDDVPFAAHVEVARCPWTPKHRLVRIGLKGREIDRDKRPQSNLVFLLDVSGSMNEPNKLPLLQQGMKLLVDHLGENDRVAIVVYASAEGLVLPSTRGDQRETITKALECLRAGGSTNGGAGIQLAYKIAEDNAIPGGVNRVILCTDGDFNVGTTSSAELERMVEERAKAGTFLTVLGFGRGNLNDAMMEKISGIGNGNYHYVDGLTEAHKVLVEEMGGTLVTIAKDVKIQIEFNPAKVAGYRLLGYENRMLAKEDFNDDTKDAGEIGAGHTVTALYEVVPAGAELVLPEVDTLKYQKKHALTDASDSGELLTLKLRYKEPDGEKSKLLEVPVPDEGKSFATASDDTKFAAAVASFGMLLRGSQYQGTTSYDAVLEIATESKGQDKHGYRAELLEMVKQAKALTGAR